MAGFLKLIAAILIVVGVLLFIVAYNLSSQQDSTRPFLCFSLSLVFGFFGRKLLFQAKKLGTKTLGVKLDQVENLILYLRSFKVDKPTGKTFASSAIQFIHPMINEGHFNTEEENLRESIGTYGVLACVGNPKHWHPNPGAIKILYEGGEWKDEIRRAMYSAKYIIIRLDDTPGTRWEFNEIFRTGNQHKALFVLPNNLEAYGKVRLWFTEARVDINPFERRIFGTVQSVVAFRGTNIYTSEPEYNLTTVRNVKTIMTALAKLHSYKAVIQSL